MKISDKKIDALYVSHIENGEAYGADLLMMDAVRTVQKILASEKNFQVNNALNLETAQLIQSAANDEAFKSLLNDFLHNPADEELRQEWRQAEVEGGCYLEYFKDYAEGDYEKYIRPLIKITIERSVSEKFSGLPKKDELIQSTLKSLADSSEQTIHIEDLYKLNEAVLHIFEKHKKRIEDYLIQKNSPKNSNISVQFSDLGKTIDADAIIDYIEHELAVRMDAAEITNYVLKEQVKSQYNKNFRAYKATDGATELLNNDQGQVFLVHTKQSARKLGVNTKWCISARDDGDNMFDHYNRDGPIFVFLPKLTDEELKASGYTVQPKYAFAYEEGAFRNQLDDEIEKPNTPEYIRKLIDATLLSLGNGERKYFENIIKIDDNEESSQTKSTNQEIVTIASNRNKFLQSETFEEQWLIQDPFIKRLHLTAPHKMPSASINDYTDEELQRIKAIVIKSMDEEINRLNNEIRFTIDDQNDPIL